MDKDMIALDFIKVYKMYKERRSRQGKNRGQEVEKNSHMKTGRKRQE